MDYIFSLKYLLLITLMADIVIGGEYGSRLLREKSLANSKLDDRITAILNGGQTIDDYFSEINTKVNANVGQNMKQLAKSAFHSVIDHNSPESSLGDDPVIEVNGSETPVGIVFKTKSPKVNVEQRHNPGTAGEIESTRSEDEPHTVRHEVFRPVIQELREVIQPYRRVVQQIQPVIEEIHQIVASSGQRVRHNTYNKAPPALALANKAPVPANVNKGQIWAILSPGNQLKPHYSSNRESSKSLSISPKRFGTLYSPQKVLNAFSQQQRDAIPYSSPKLMQSMSINRPVQSQSDSDVVLGGALSGVANDDNRSLYGKARSNDDNGKDWPNDGFYLDYKVPISFDLADSKVIKQNFFDSKLFELNLSDSSNEFNNKFIYSLANNLSQNDLNLIKASIEAKTNAKY